MTLNRKLQNLLDAEQEKTNTHGVILRVQSGDGQVDFKGSAGDATPDTRFPIASIAKMFTSALIMQLADKGLLELDQKVQGILTDVDLSGLHIVKGVDYSPHLTIRQLLHQTSGLADYYESDLARDLKQGKDRSYNLDDVLQMTRALKPQAAPDSGKSYYSDTNYQLLGAVIEAVTGQAYAQALQTRICEPLGLKETGVLQGTDVGLPVYHKDKRLNIPQILNSMTSDGGIISTLDEMLIFLRAFMAGQLFASKNTEQMHQWNPLFFPFSYGYGIMRIKLPRWLTLFRATPELIGHSGASASFAYYAPEQDIGFMWRVLGLIAKNRGSR